MSALTMTLLPEPVAPAISRCGILDRSTAWARPATSRPSANVSVDPDAEKSTSSRIRRSATMLNSLLGISIPTALLPGIGASIRMLRAASAIDRSSWSASIRLSLMCGAGCTSYWVTTGPALRPMTRASMSKLASFLTMISSLRAWIASALSVVAAVGTSPGSSRSWGGRRHSMASRVGGESEASVTSSGPRETGSDGLAGGGPRRPAGGTGRSRRHRPPGRARTWTMSARPTARRSGSRGPPAPFPTRRSGPGASTAGIRAPRPFPAAAAPTAAAPAAGAAPFPLAGAGSAVLVVRSWSVEPATLASPVAGDSIDRSGRSNAISSPATSSSSDSTNAPGVVSSGCEDAHQEAADATAGPLVEGDELEQAQEARVGHRDAQQRPPPRRAGLLARPPLHVPAGQQEDEREQPAPGPEERHGQVAPPVGQAPLAGEQQGDQGDGAQAQQEDPHQRADDGRRQPQRQLRERQPATGRAAARRRARTLRAAGA